MLIRNIKALVLANHETESPPAEKEVSKIIDNWCTA